MKTVTTTTIATLFATMALASFAQAADDSKKSLYERLGGIQKIADIVSQSIDMEAKDPVLLGNERLKMVADPKASAALKFVVTETLASGIGGPQTMVHPTLPEVMAWFMMTPEQNDRAWTLRMGVMTKAGVPMDVQMELRKWMDEATMKAKPMAPEMPEMFKDSKSLYARLGGFAGIATVVDEFINRLAGDPMVAGNPHVAKSLTSGKITAAGLKFLVTEQLVAAAGGPWKYTGRNMAEAHKGLMVTEKEWDVSAKILKEVLDKYHVPAREQGEVFAAITATKKDIVDK